MPLDRVGPYKLQKILGRGGMGAVYAAQHDSGERAAIKLLAPTLADDPNFRERFKVEIETLKKLRHPNIVQLFAYGEEDGHLYYVMELVEGRSLQDELSQGRRFQWREVARIGVEVAKALKHAHDRGIVHRDLKPANLLVDAQDAVKLTDFGIAKLFGGTNITSAGGVLGTADYMAPEQAEGKTVTSRCDLYALGSVLYALLAGRPPFAAQNITQVLHGLRYEKPIPIRRLASDVPAEFELIIEQLLEKDPQLRIPTALAVANRLKAMELALSLDKRGADPELDELNADAALLEEPGKTSSALAAAITAPLPEDDYRLSPLDGPTVTPGHAAPGRSPSARTAAGEATLFVPGPGATSGEGAELVETPPPRGTHFTTVAEAELRQAEAASISAESPLAVALKVGGMALAGLLLLAAVWWASRPPSADRLYRQVFAAAEAGEPQQLADVESQAQQFMERFPDDPRTCEVQGWLEELELFRLQRRFELKARRLGGAEALAPVERAYLDATRLALTQPTAGAAKLQALLDLFGGSPDPAATPAELQTTQRCLELARKQLERLRQSAELLRAQQEQFVQRRLERAERLASTDPRQAQAIARGVVELYGEQAWANDFVERAKRLLDSLPADALPPDELAPDDHSPPTPPGP